jgi:hypothetical protein
LATISASTGSCAVAIEVAARAARAASAQQRLKAFSVRNPVIIVSPSGVDLVAEGGGAGAIPTQAAASVAAKL